MRGAITEAAAPCGAAASSRWPPDHPGASPVKGLGGGDAVPDDKATTVPFVPHQWLGTTCADVQGIAVKPADMVPAVMRPVGQARQGPPGPM